MSVQASDDTFYPWVWWAGLTAASIANIAAVSLWRPRAKQAVQDPATRRYQEIQLTCAKVFVAACALRSIMPRVDVERICFFDSVLSSTLVGRSAATVAEQCFAWQMTSALHRVATDMQLASPQTVYGVVTTRRVAHFAFWAIAVAECCSWCGVLTTRQIWHGVEESIWMVSFGLFSPCALALLMQLNKVTIGGTFTRSERQRAVTFLSTVAAGCAAFAVFMVTVDVPMYIERYHRDNAQGVNYLTLAEGVFDAASCKEVSQSYSVWGEEIPWMSAYFTACVWLSVWLVSAPCLSVTTGAASGLSDRELTPQILAAKRALLGGK